MPKHDTLQRAPRAPALAFVLTVAAVATLAAGTSGCGNGEASTEQATVATITLAPENVAVVAEQTLQAGPEISGTLRARRAASLRAEVSGAVLEVLAQAGDRVKQGDLLARIDDSALADATLAARSGVSAAKNALAVAESNAQRSRTLAEAGALSSQQAEQADAALEGARAALADAQARAASAAQQAGKTRVRAPFAGVVSERQVSAGDVVAPGTPLFTVIDPTRLEFEAAVPAAQVGQITPGAGVQFRVTGFGEDLEGKVDRVNPSVDPATGQVRLYVDVPNADGRLIAGLYAQGRVATEQRTAPAAPETAVDASSKPPTVLRVANGKVQKVPVELAVRDDVKGAVGFASGVKAGDVLVLGSARGQLADGAAVQVAKPAAQRGQGSSQGTGSAADSKAN